MSELDSQTGAGQNARNFSGDQTVSSGVIDAASIPDPFVNQPARAARSSVAAQAIMASITGYQRFLSPLKAQPTCRFYPSCSQYALEAVRLHGAVAGSWLAIKRISKCHPLHPGGLDPVPPARVRQGFHPSNRLLEDR
jgi:uncharacterized protein